MNGDGFLKYRLALGRQPDDERASVFAGDRLGDEGVRQQPLDQARDVASRYF